MCSAEMKQGKNGQNFLKNVTYRWKFSPHGIYIKYKWSVKNRFIKLDSKQKPSMFCVQQTHFACKVLDRLNLKI